MLPTTLKMSPGNARTPLRRFVLVTLAAGLSIAAILAIAGILTGRLDRTDDQLIYTSLAFSVCSALGAAGARARDRGVAAPLSIGTQVLAALTFLLLLLALWAGVHGDFLGRVFGVTALAALAGAHACLVLSASLRGDSRVVRVTTGISLVATALFSAFLIGLVVGVISGSDAHRYLRAVAVIVVVMLLTSALPSVLRRLAPAKSGQPPPGDLRAELGSIAASLERLAPGAGEASVELLAEVARLRRLGSELGA